MESIRDSFPKITDKKIREKWQKIISDSAEGVSSGSSNGDRRSVHTEEDQAHFHDVYFVDHVDHHYYDDYSYGQEDQY